MGSGNFKRNRFRGDSPRNNQILCYDCNQPGHMRNECPLNKKAKKKKKKIKVETWSNSDSSSSDGVSEVETAINLCLMKNDDEVCDDKLDDYDTLQNEYECLFNDFEKLKHRCKNFKKIISSLTRDLENAKNEYDIVI